MEFARSRQVLEAGRTSIGGRQWQPVVDLPMDHQVGAAVLVAELPAS